MHTGIREKKSGNRNSVRGKFKLCGYFATYEEAHEAAKVGKLKMYAFLKKRGIKLNEEIALRDFCP